MADNLPPYPFSDQPASGEAGYAELGTLDDILDKVHEHGLVNVTPGSENDAERQQAHQLRNRTTATRLWLLGYLKDKPDRDVEPERLVNHEFRSAIQYFQRDAGLKVDGWVGDKTWYAMEALVSYESDTRVDLWYHNGNPLPALERAVQLRLFSLGLFPHKPTPEFNGLPPGALNNLVYINIMFNLADVRNLPAAMYLRTVKVLFDQDNIVKKLSEARTDPKRFKYNRDLTRAAKDDTLANRFIVNVAKVELWLVGFEIPIDGQDNFTIGNTTYQRKNTPLMKGLAKYWEQLEGKSSSKAQSLARSITPDLFVSFQTTKNEADKKSDSAHEDYTQEVVAEFEKGPKKKVNEAWQFIKTGSVSLWDGLKRVWNWIKRGIKKVISFSKNIFRAFFRYASKAYKIVKLGITAVMSSFKYYFQGGLSGSSADTVAFLHQHDFDQTAFLNRGANLKQVEALSEKLKVQTAFFRLGSKIVALLFGIFKKLATGIIGWARILLALVKALKELKPIYNDIKVLKPDLL